MVGDLYINYISTRTVREGNGKAGRKCVLYLSFVDFYTFIVRGFRIEKMILL